MEEMESEITQEEIEKAIKGMPNENAPGPMGSLALPSSSVGTL
jgi:hypothetical protein